MRRRIERYPVGCPYCDQLQGRPNGTRQTNDRGKVQRILCQGCGKQWSKPLVQDESIFRSRRQRFSSARLLPAMKLLALGLPLSWVGRILRIGQRSIKSKLVYVLNNAQGEELSAVLSREPGVTDSELCEFETAFIVGTEFDPTPVFRCWGQQFRRMDLAHRRKVLRRAAKVLDTPMRSLQELLKLTTTRRNGLKARPAFRQPGRNLRPASHAATVPVLRQRAGENEPAVFCGRSAE